MDSAKEQPECRHNSTRFGSIAPILGHIRAFEATARLGSMTLAAKEANTTVSSISRHNRIISEFLGAVLFETTNRNLKLTDAGSILFHSVSSAFGSIEEAATFISEHRQGNSIKAFTNPALLQRWLVPKLNTFLQKHSDISIKLHSQESREYISPHVMFSFEPVADHSEALIPDEMIPVLAPKLTMDFNGTYRLICTRSDMSDWDDWFPHIPALQSHKTSKIYIADESAALEAAICGLGVALCRRSVIQVELAEHSLGLFGGYHLKKPTFVWCTRPQSRSLGKEERLFLAFLKSEAMIGKQNT